MATTIASTVLVHMTCTHEGCGIVFAVPEPWRDERRRDHATFYCPNGHARWFPGESDVEQAQRLARDTAATLARERARHDQTKAALEHAERSRRATVGHLTRTRKRVAHGVCPCCNRSFVALARHMETKHPEYVAESPR